MCGVDEELWWLGVDGVGWRGFLGSWFAIGLQFFQKFRVKGRIQAEETLLANYAVVVIHLVRVWNDVAALHAERAQDVFGPYISIWIFYSLVDDKQRALSLSFRFSLRFG